jgi:hypothetical protein
MFASVPLPRVGHQHFSKPPHAEPLRHPAALHGSTAHATTVTSVAKYTLHAVAPAKPSK